MARKTIAKRTTPTMNATKPHATVEPTNQGNEPIVQSKAKGKKKVTVGEGSRQSKGKRKAADVLVESVDRDSRMDGSDEAQSNNDQLEAEARRENATGKVRSKKKVTFVEPTPTKAHSKKKVTFVEPTKAHSNKKVTFVEPTPTKAHSKKKVTFVEPTKAHRSVTFPLPEDLLSDDELKQKYPDVRLQKWMTTKRNLELVSRLHANMAQELEVVLGEGTQDSIFVTAFNALGKTLDEFIAIHMVVPPSLVDKDVGGSKAAVANKQRIAATITKRYTRAAFKKGVAVDGAGTATVGGGAAKPTVKK